MKAYNINGEDFESEYDAETIIWIQPDGGEVDITNLIAALDSQNNDIHRLFREKEEEAEEDDHSDEKYEARAGK